MIGDDPHHRQLINVQSQAHLWSENYEREFRSIFAIQREIAEQVAGPSRSG